jgi:hypothetical protein
MTGQMKTNGGWQEGGERGEQAHLEQWGLFLFSDPVLPPLLLRVRGAESPAAEAGATAAAVSSNFTKYYSFIHISSNF